MEGDSESGVYIKGLLVGVKGSGLRVEDSGFRGGVGL